MPQGNKSRVKAKPVKRRRVPKMTLEKKIKAITLKEQETKVKVFPLF
ncbi:hypothetical protein ES705_39470 [subsurface metagenome]